MAVKWIEPYRKYILKYALLLQQQGFSFIGEDDFSMKYTDGDIFITFSVERYSDFLDVWIEYLSDDSKDDNQYRLDMIIRVFHKKDFADLFAFETEEDKDILIKNYIKFILSNREKLFSKIFPLAREYEEYDRVEGQKLLDSFLR